MVGTSVSLSPAVETPPVSAGTTVTRGTTTIPVAPPPNLANPEKVVSVHVCMWRLLARELRSFNMGATVSAVYEV